MKYFPKGQYNIITLKSKYRELSKAHHPDTGGNTVAFQELNQEYKELLERIKKQSSNSGTKEDIQSEIDSIDKFLELFGITNPVQKQMAKMAFKIGGKALMQYLNQNIKK